MTRQDILQAAAQIFAEKGYHASSMADIADIVGVRKASLYHHVDSKQEILIELLDQGLDLLIERVEEVTLQDLSFEQKFKEAIKAYILTLTEYRDLSSVLLLEHRSMVKEDLQRNFSLLYTLSLFLVDALGRLDRGLPTYPLDLLSLVEAILESPQLILIRQEQKLKDDKMAHDLKETIASLRVVAERLRKGEGTVGKLMADDTLYKEIRRLVKDFSDSLEDTREQVPITTFTNVIFSAF